MLEKEKKFKKTTFRNEIENMIESSVEILNFGNHNENTEDIKDIDEYENMNISDEVQKITKKIMAETNEIGLNLFIANKKVKFVFDQNQEAKYKKFLLLSTIIGLSTLSYTGNMVLKVN